MIPVNDHIYKQFDIELRTLKDKLLRMAGVVERHIASAMRALDERDIAGAEKVERADTEVNLLEMEVDEMCVRMLALRQPAASDLRFIAAALKINTDLERVGDLAVNIAERAEDLARTSQMLPSVDLSRMAEAAQAMLRDSLDAFVYSDAEKAEAVLSRDQFVDDLFREAFRDITAVMKSDPSTVDRGLGLIFIAKHIERIGDHATNVAEMVVYLVRGQDVRHKYSVLTRRGL